MCFFLDCSAFFEYLRDYVDLSHVKADLQDQRPKTQYYRDLQQQNLTPLLQWLSWLCERANGGDAGVSQVRLCFFFFGVCAFFPV